MTKRADILSRNDAGEHAPAIAKALDVSIGYVYGVLRDSRPDRARKPRDKTSELRRMITGLAAQGISPVRVAFLLQESCTRQYVYKIISEAD